MGLLDDDDEEDVATNGSSDDEFVINYGGGDDQDAEEPEAPSSKQSLSSKSETKAKKPASNTPLNTNRATANNSKLLQKPGNASRALPVAGEDRGSGVASTSKGSASVTKPVAEPIAPSSNGKAESVSGSALLAPRSDDIGDASRATTPRPSTAGRRQARDDASDVQSEDEEVAPLVTRQPPRPISPNHNSNGSRRPSSVVSNAPTSELGTFLTMDLDFDPEAAVQASRRAAAAMASTRASISGAAARPSVVSDPASVAAAPIAINPGASQATYDPQRLARVERAVNAMLDESYTANPMTAQSSIEPPPLFNGSDLSVLIEQVLVKVAEETGAPSADDVVAIFHPSTVTSEEEKKIGGVALGALNVKLRTSNSIITELGKRLDKLQRWTSEVSGRAATLEQDRIEHDAIVAALKEKAKMWKLRAETAEAAKNTFERVHRPSTAMRHIFRSDEMSETEDGVHDDEDGVGGFVQEDHTANVKIKVPSLAFGEFNRAKGVTKFTTDTFKVATDTRPMTSTKGSFATIPLNNGDSAGSQSSPLPMRSTKTRTPLVEDASPTTITRSVILNTARVLGVKKKFDPPTVLSVGLQNSVEKEEQLSANIMSHRHLRKSPYQMEATSYRTNKVQRLFQAAQDHSNHLSSVLSAQTRELLSTNSPDMYIRVLHTQLNSMVRSLHDCIDALSEEQRATERWRMKWLKANAQLDVELERRRKEELKAVVQNSGTAGLERWPFAVSGPITETMKPYLAEVIGGLGGGIDYNSRRSAVKSAFRPTSSIATHRRSKSAESVLDHSNAVNAQQQKSNRPQYQPEPAIANSIPETIALPSTPKISRRHSHVTKAQLLSYAMKMENPDTGTSSRDSVTGRVMTAPEPREVKRVFVPSVKVENGDTESEETSASRFIQPREFTKVETPGKSIEFVIPESKKSKYMSLMPAIAAPTPFAGTGATTPVAKGRTSGGGTTKQRAYTAHPSNRWETSSKISERFTVPISRPATSGHLFQEQ